MWEVTGTPAKRAASLLARNSITKQSQLCLATNGNVAKERSSLARCKLKERKATDKVPQTFGIAWPYFSGFFDAEGHVKVRPNANCLELELWQKQPLILTLLHFLEDKGFDSWRIHTRRNEHFFIGCSTTEVSKQILRQLLANGLSFKGEQAQQAQIALQLNASNRGELRGKLFQLCGQQGRYRHLDPEGREERGDP